MSRILTCEQVSDGHPDKICDQVADAIVTDCLVHDKESVYDTLELPKKSVRIP